ncbi:MAG: gamma-glutamyl-gamma-aminobutyrate hydrolase family protein [Verrucomicrobiota bacterium]
MNVFVDMEHQKLRVEHPELWAEVCRRRVAAKYRFEEIGAEPCYLLHYSRFSAKLLEELNPRVVIFSGHNMDHSEYAADEITPIQSYFRAPGYPTFCICGSFQLLAKTYGASIGPIGNKTVSGEGRIDPIIPATARSETGFCSIELGRKPGTAFHRASARMEVFQHHFWEVKSLPDGFQTIATSPVTKIQAIQHETKPLIGVQFHPEDYEEDSSDGRILIEQVFTWANQYEESNPIRN